MKVFELIDIVDGIVTFADAFDDDKVNLLIGSGKNDVSSIVVSHDLDTTTLDYCLEKNINTVISYHPATYRQFDNLNEDLMLSKLSLQFYKENINVISIHTAQDVCSGGNSDTLSEIFELSNIKVFGHTSKEKGVGRIGEVTNLNSNSLQALIKVKLNTEILRTNSFFQTQEDINTLAFVPGSGTQFIDEVLGRVDVFITGDVSHHHFLLGDEYGMGIVQLNHIATEKPGMQSFTNKISKALQTEIKYLYSEYYE